MAGVLQHIGNKEILKLKKTAFLCSRKVPASIILKCYDWAIEQRESGICVISGFHSQIERDVYNYLAKGSQPIIIAMARSIPEKLPAELMKKVDKGTLLIVSPFNKKITKVTINTASLRNRMMIEIADKVVVGCADPQGNLIRTLKASDKIIEYLNS